MENYTNCIVPYLKILGEYDPEKIKKIEQELLIHLEQNDMSVARYRRVKTDKSGKWPLYHKEAEAFFHFFNQCFTNALGRVKDDRHRKTLEIWMPSSTLDIYYHKQVQTA